MSDLTSIRDGTIIALAIALALGLIVSLLVLLVAGYFAFKLRRRLRRLHTQRLAGRLTAFRARQEDWNERGAFEPAGLATAAVGLMQAVRERRRRKRRRFPLSLLSR